MMIIPEDGRVRRMAMLRAAQGHKGNSGRMMVAIQAPAANPAPSFSAASQSVVRSALALLAALWVAVLLTSSAFAQDRRVALVVGADRYRHIPALNNATNDARALARRLGELGFEVVGPVMDPTREQFLAALDQFDRRLNGAEAGLFFFAGHAVEIEGRNILLPVDAPAATSRRLVEASGVMVADVLNEMQARTPRVIAILDSCRDNPLPRDATRGGAPVVGSAGGLSTRGLEPIGGSGRGGRFVVFAAEPGATALDRLPNDPPSANGLFTRHLLSALDTPQRPLTAVMTEVRDRVAASARAAGREQRPHLDDRMEGSGEFMLARGVVPPPSPQPAPPAPAPAALELAFWQSIQGSQRAEEFEAYLRQFPQGTFADLARARIAALRAPALPAPQPQPAPPATEAAIELSFWRSIQNSRNRADFDEYLRRYPNGNFADTARNRASSLHLDELKARADEMDARLRQIPRL